MTKKVELTKEEAIALVLAAAEILRYKDMVNEKTIANVISAVEKLNHAFNLGIENS
jgi:hypothetical protein